MADEILKLKQQIQSLTLIPGDGGVFDVTVNGERIFSKLEAGRFPDPAEIMQKIRARL